MTPKEKAEKLVQQYIYRTTGYVNINDAKQCALIAVDEKIKLYNELNEYGLLHPNSIGLELHEIKTEIEKI